MELKIFKEKIEKITPYEKNSKEHPKEQIKKIRESIETMGFNDPIAVDENYVIITGHGRYLAAKELGLKEVPIIQLKHLDDIQKKQYRIAHNKLTMSTGFNLEMLKVEIEEISLAGGSIELTGLSEIEVEKLEISIEGKLDLTEEKIPEPDENKIPFSKKGDIFTMGKHKLLCGDSRILSDVELLMGEEKGNLIITDPPYNVDYTGKTAEKMTIENDHMSPEDFKIFLQESFQNMSDFVEKGSGIYVFYADTESINFKSAFEKAGFKHSQTCIWMKNAIVMGRQDYHWQHEPIMVGWKLGGSHNWYSDRKQSTVWNFDKPTKNTDHPTPKPIPLLSYPISNSSKKGDLVLDFFGGSGSTLIACENLGRKCYTIELAPKYVDVILKRYILLGKNDIVLFRNGIEEKYSENWGLFEPSEKGNGIKKIT